MSESAGANKLQARTRAIAKPIVTRLWTINREGYDRLPAEGPVILCPNHISFLDSAFLMLTLPRNITFVGKAEYMDSWKTKFLFPAMGMIPIDRSGGSKSQAALETAEAVLRRGELFGIFPEGTRTADGTLGEFKPGFVALVRRAGVPVYPVGIAGAFDALPRRAKFLKRTPVRVVFGEPFTVDELKGEPSEISDHARSRIAACVDEAEGWLRESRSRTSGRKNTATRTAAWRKLLDARRVWHCALEEADHTFSSRAWRDEVAARTCEWVHAQWPDARQVASR